MYQLQGPPVVNLRVMSHQNKGVDLHCLEVLNNASLNWHTLWVIHLQERHFYFSALLDTYCKLLQILMLSLEKERNTLCPTTTPWQIPSSTPIIYHLHFGYCSKSGHSWFAAAVYRGEVCSVGRVG
jgi:hypothetical protein